MSTLRHLNYKFAIKQPRIIAAARKQHGNIYHGAPPTSKIYGGGPSKPPQHNLVLGLLMAAGASAAFRSIHTPKHHHLHTNSSHASITIKKPVDYSSVSTFPSSDIGTLGGLTPNNWGLPYNGKNPAIALVMASAGVTLRMVINVTIIYLIKIYWLDDAS